MRLLIINEVCGHTSTGKICGKIADEYASRGWTVKIAYGRDGYVPEQCQKYAYRIGNDLDVKIAATECRLFDNAGFSNKRSTRKFVQWAEEWKPDLVWLHNLHGYYINVELLFEWLKKNPKIEKRWTLHDCWSFTGHCVHFSMINCKRWESHCYHCPQKRKYPVSYLLDRSYKNFDRKKSLFTGVENLTIITPSQWLADLVKNSYLQGYPVHVVNNSIDKTIFKPTPSDFRDRYDLNNKTVILGVANAWDERKGLADFYKLAKLLDERYAIVLVGLSNKQIRDLSKNIIGFKQSKNEGATIYYAVDKVMDSSAIKGREMTQKETRTCETSFDIHKQTVRKGVEKVICISKTKDQVELAKIYSAADIFVNLTYEDNYPTVNLEARACGKNVITYDSGGCRETVTPNELCETGDLNQVLEKIKRLNID